MMGDIGKAVAVGMVPFLLGDALKAALAVAIREGSAHRLRAVADRAACGPPARSACKVYPNSPAPTRTRAARLGRPPCGT